MHARPRDTVAYARLFRAPFKFGATYNGHVMPREWLERPMLRAQPGLHAAFELHAQACLEKLRAQDGISGRVRSLIVERLRGGDIDMLSIGRELAMSVATLRRRLEEEGTTHSRILDEVRQDLAKRYLRDPKFAVPEIAFLLGFSHQLSGLVVSAALTNKQFYEFATSRHALWLSTDGESNLPKLPKVVPMQPPRRAQR